MHKVSSRQTCPKHAHTHEGSAEHQHGEPHTHHEHEAHNGHGEHNGHQHEHGHHHIHPKAGSSTLVIRPYTGIAGDIMVAGLAGLLGADQDVLDEIIAGIGIKELPPSSFVLSVRMVNAVSGLGGTVNLPHEHAHRSFKDIHALIESSSMLSEAKALAVDAFRIIAEAEGAVHGKDAESVTFHEVGALDSILDICLAASLFTRLAPESFICGPLPVCDGTITCAHGEIPSPAPAVMRMLHDVPITGFPGVGETVTPTGIALLKAFGAQFGPWPSMILERETIAYGTKVFPNVPNGAVFAFGTRR